MTASDSSIGDLLISKTDMPARRARVPRRAGPKKPVSVVLMPFALALAAFSLAERAAAAAATTNHQSRAPQGDEAAVMAGSTDRHHVRMLLSGFSRWMALIDGSLRVQPGRIGFGSEERAD